jgi:hypothetical protein
MPAAITGDHKKISLKKIRCAIPTGTLRILITTSTTERTTLVQRRGKLAESNLQAGEASEVKSHDQIIFCYYYLIKNS